MSENRTLFCDRCPNFGPPSDIIIMKTDSQIMDSPPPVEALSQEKSGGPRPMAPGRRERAVKDFGRDPANARRREDRR